MKTFFPIVFFSFLINGCVSFKTFNDIEDLYASQKMKYRTSQNENKLLSIKIDSLSEGLELKINLLKVTNESLTLKKSELSKLQNDYTFLSSKSDSDIKARINENNGLLDSLALKQYELSKGLERVGELERLVIEKEQNLSLLKKNLSDALLSFKGKGLTVEQRNGKVYVSMENKLLFKSGSWTVGNEGKKAINQLSNVLAENPEINVLIEGHTDNVPYSGDGPIKNNWDLSTKRATSIVQLLLNNKQILPQNITAAGRGEFLPVGPNSNEKGKSSNRRIEVILTPQLDAITELLENLN
ncbi:MAG: chemotaxis protein MotB [Candidatus Marivariicella framensis]|jgi:chemotaxis protein MotB|tara:strand:+ start:4356 stop:5252 length:897 start_codon:yes stop_codon:yes gene_type:complete